VLARIAFLFSLTPYSLWRAGHNVVHHGFNNLRGRDFVWEPLSAEDYRALPPWRRRVEHLYRSALGPGVYYFVEIWWKRMFFPNRHNMSARRLEFLLDSCLAALAMVVWVGGLVWYSLAHDGSWVTMLLIAFAAPFMLWNWSMALVVYLHHTDPEVRWYSDKVEWQQSKAQVSSTLHVLVPRALGAWMHQIMEHPAHHLNATIPLYNLKAAQQHLYETGAAFKRSPLTLRHYLDCVRTCKLYDYSARCWIPFPKT
jgi:omega-6 fatty acid desaturase (delta-12 desaturase)